MARLRDHTLNIATSNANYIETSHAFPVSLLRETFCDFQHAFVIDNRERAGICGSSYHDFTRLLWNIAVFFLAAN